MWGNRCPRPGRRRSARDRSPPTNRHARGPARRPEGWTDRVHRPGREQIPAPAHRHRHGRPYAIRGPDSWSTRYRRTPTPTSPSNHQTPGDRHRPSASTRPPRRHPTPRPTPPLGPRSGHSPGPSTASPTGRTRSGEAGLRGPSGDGGVPRPSQLPSRCRCRSLMCSLPPGPSDDFGDLDSAAHSVKSNSFAGKRIRVHTRGSDRR